MRKKTLLVLCMAVALVFMTACGGQTTTPSETNSVPSSENPASENTSMSPSIPNEATTIKLGLGILSRTSDSMAAGQTNLGNANNLTVVCAVAVDENDVIRKVKFDSVKTNLEFDAKGLFTGDINEPVRTKKEMGYDYGLGESSEIKKEWFEQIKSFEDWATGRTVNEVLALELNEENIPVAEELKSSISIGVSDQLAALKKAYEDAKA